VDGYSDPYFCTKYDSRVQSVHNVSSMTVSFELGISFKDNHILHPNRKSTEEERYINDEHNKLVIDTSIVTSAILLMGL
jgi:hypothetical protein